MSFSPPDARRSSPSNSISIFPYPSADHGSVQPCQSLDLPAVSGVDSSTVGSMRISAPAPVRSSGCLAGGSGDYSFGSFKKMSGAKSPKAKKVSHSRISDTSQGELAGPRGPSPQFKTDQSRSTQLSGNATGAVISSHVDRLATGLRNPQGGNANSGSRKNMSINGNHLLNFYYDPISRSKPRTTLPRRPKKIKPYDKDLFLQANFKFVVFGSVEPHIESMDPDKMLQWKNVICVRYSTPFPVQCPICLESPLCPQITSCGHIFCFPCILRYMLMGEKDRNGEIWKKCPLCFMNISLMDLYTICIDYVKQYHVGDFVNFTLLIRPKDSLAPFHKSHGTNSSLESSDEFCDSFSKFTLTSDVELSVREAKLELDKWLIKAESGLVDDMEQVPYVCAALQHLDQRKKRWEEYRTLSRSLPTRNFNIQSLNLRSRECEPHDLILNSCADIVHPKACESNSILCKNERNATDSHSPKKLDGEDFFFPDSDACDPFASRERESNLYVEEKGYRRQSHVFHDARDSYTFYQATDGQHLILHPLNMKCLLGHYGSYDLLPSRIGGRILQMETVTQTEATRRRYRFLSHFSLTTTFQLCEIDLSGSLPPEALFPFMDEIRKREKLRKRIANKENKEKARAEVAAAAAMSMPPLPSDFKCNSNDAAFSIDDFEALGSSSMSSTSPFAFGNHRRFSDVTRLAGDDSPSLKAVESTESVGSLEMVGETSNSTGGEISNPTGSTTAAAPSFASIIAAAKSEGNAGLPKTNDSGKKVKKPGWVLLSTAGARRY